MMPRPPPSAAQPAFPPAAFQQFQQNYYQAMQPQAQLMHPTQQATAAHPGQPHQAQYLQPNPYVSAMTPTSAQQRPLLVAGRIIPHPQFYPYELKPGRMPPFDILAAQLHKKKVNLACHFCDHAARRPGRQKTALLISCQSPHCRKVFCSRPSCFKKLPAELGIQSPDRFCEWKRQVESGVAGMTFICPHCRDEAGCPGPQCAKRWRKRLARANNKRSKDDLLPDEGEEAAPELPMKKEVRLVDGTGAGQAAAGSESNGVHSGMNGNGVASKAVIGNGSENVASQSREAVYAHPAALQMQQAVVNGTPQQRSPTSLAQASAAVAYSTAAASFKPYSTYQSGDPNAQPRSSMDLLAGVSDMGEMANGAASASAAESAPAAHQQLLQFLQQRQKEQEEQAQQTQAEQPGQQPQSDHQAANDTSAQSAIQPAGYTLTAYPTTAASTPPATSPPASAATAGQYVYNGTAGTAAGGQPFFTSPQLSPMMSPHPTALVVPSSMMSMHTSQFSSSNSPHLGPLSPATAYYSATAHLMPTVPSLSLTATSNGAADKAKKSAVVEVGGQPDREAKNGPEQSEAATAGQNGSSVSAS